jgi:hypothetical protein
VDHKGKQGGQSITNGSSNIYIYTKNRASNAPLFTSLLYASSYALRKRKEETRQKIATATTKKKTPLNASTTSGEKRKTKQNNSIGKL